MSDPKDINPFPETDSDAPKDMPPLTVMSLSVRTVVNHKENKREVVCASARIWTNSESVPLFRGFRLLRHNYNIHAYIFPPP